MKKRESKFFILFIVILVLSNIYFKWLHVLEYKVQALIFSSSDLFFQKMSFLDYFQSKKRLQEENDNLKSEIRALSFLKISNLALKQDLEEIKSLLKDNDEEELELLRLEPSVAPRIDYLSFIRTLPENENYLIFADAGFLLADKRAGKSKFARLLSARERVIPAYILSGDKEQKEKIKIKLYGKGAGAFTAQLNKEYKLKVGDPIYFKSYPIAIVRKLESDEQSPYQIVYAGLPINLNNLDFVLIKAYER